MQFLSKPVHLMVPGDGPLSNFCDEFSTAQKPPHEDFQKSPNTEFDADHFRELFDTLAESNHYLENHVPEAARLLHADEEVQP